MHPPTQTDTHLVSADSGRDAMSGERRPLIVSPVAQQSLLAGGIFQRHVLHAIHDDLRRAFLGQPGLGTVPVKLRGAIRVVEWEGGVCHSVGGWLGWGGGGAKKVIQNGVCSTSLRVPLKNKPLSVGAASNQ